MNNSENNKKELYLRILDQFPNPIWRSGLDAKCNYFNKAWLEFTGRTIEQEMGDGWAEGVHPDDLKSCFDTYTNAFKKREHFEMEYRLKYRDGTFHWTLDSGSPFFDDQGLFLGYIGSCYDINEHKMHLIDVEKLNKVMIDRELKMIELKKENELLKTQLKNK